MGHEATTAQRRERAAVEWLLPALLLAHGLEAWRTAAVVASAAPWLAAMVAVPVTWAAAGGGLRLGRAWGVRRAAAAVAAAMAGLRLAVQLGGPGWAVVWAAGGVGLLVAYAALWPAGATPRRALHGLLLGFNLHLAERLAGDTLDLVWQRGVGPLLLVTALSLPMLVVGGFELLSRQVRPWRQEAAPQAMPLVVALLATVLAQPVRVAPALGGSVPLACLVLALANAAACAVALHADGLLGRATGRSAEARLARLGYHGLRTALTAVLVVGVWQGAHLPVLLAVAVGPAAVAVNAGALLRARPIGRRRRVLGWTLAGGWLFAACATMTAVERWPAPLLAVLLFSLASVALYHPARLEESPERSLRWPWLAHGAVAFGASIVVLVAALGGHSGILRSGPLRLATVRVAARGEALRGPFDLARLGDGLRELQPTLVVLRGVAPRDADGLDPAVWLADRLGLRAYRATPSSGVAVLAETRPTELQAVVPGVVLAVWRLGAGGFALAAADDGPGARRAAQRAVAICPRWAIAGEVGTASGAGEAEGDTGQDLTPPAAAAEGQVLLVDPDTNPVSVSTKLLSRPRRRVVTALLELSP